ncbi:photosystem I reaction center subunit XI [Acaryochloris sp. IP29b_bin.137]|uniref:Photosystem I reaction center subunit XI n=1 Tax=Acaryochloris sp. NBRC 102871 TaxID=3139767 RepID=A0AAT9GVB0_9CYAN|nr:photosystem I reaction center subunit XI [Acaryochloris sp. IP29b_bin.137]
MTMDLVKHGGDPLVGDLATPVNSSGIVKAWINNLPAYRKGMSANARGLEIGMAHGYYLYGPFATSGPIRGTTMSLVSGVLSASAVIIVLSVAIQIYSSVSSAKPLPSVTTADPGSDFGTKEGWSAVGSGFLIGGCGGAVIAGVLSYAIAAFVG